MTARTKSSLKQAFKRFVELVKGIEDVQYVAAFDDEELDFFTYIASSEQSVYSSIHNAEAVVVEEFPDLLIDFHVRYMQGRPIETFIRPLPPLLYRKGNSG